MADIEAKAEAEAAHKGLTGSARRAYIGGVWNRVKHAHAKATTPGGHAVPKKLMNRRARQQAREDARNAMRPHQEAIANIRKQREFRLGLHRDEEGEKRERKAAPPAPAPKPAKPPLTDAEKRERGLRNFPRARDRQIRDAIKHGAPDFPPGVGQPKAAALTPRPLTEYDRYQIEQRLRQHRTSTGQTPSLDSPTMPKPAWFYRELYGEGQTRAALDRLTTANLRETAITSGVASSGTRAQLLDRLVAAAEEQANERSGGDGA